LVERCTHRALTWIDARTVLGLRYAFASVLAEVLASFTDLRQTEALASVRAKEGAFRALIFVNARQALAALFAPALSARAFVHNDEFIINQLFDCWNSSTYAKALAFIPHEIFRTSLFEAAALALF
jgi:hypothetical protein